MLVDRKREKLLNAILFFKQNTLNCGKIKLYKLLYFLDFAHYSETGRSVTGLDYFAWDRGPVPKALEDEIHKPNEDMAEKMEFRFSQQGTWEILEIIPKSECSLEFFSKRERRLMERLVEVFKYSDANQMIKATHLKNQPWDFVYNDLDAQYEKIPYELVLEAEDKEEILALAKESKEVWDNYA